MVRLTLSAVFAALLLAACTASQPAADAPTEGTPQATLGMAETVPNTGTIQVRDPWLLPPGTQPQGQGQAQDAPFENASDLFLTLVNPGDAPDSVMAVQTDAAQTAGFYIMQIGQRFTAVPEINLPADSELTLVPEPGYHIVLQDFTRELQVGDTISVTLLFGRSDPVTVQAEVRTPPPGQGQNQGQGSSTVPDPPLPGQYEIRVTTTPQP